MEILTGNPPNTGSRNVVALKSSGRLNFRQDAGPPATLLAQFREYFDLVPALRPRMVLEAYRVRYQVYCREVKLSGFESERYPDGLEFDEFDGQSEHYLLRHRTTGTVAGTVRVVMNLPHHEKQFFPIEYIASKELPSNCLESRGIKREQVGEISRFILTRRFRSRRGEWRWPDGLSRIPNIGPIPGHERRTNLHPILGLIRALVAVSQKNNLQYWFAGMEPRLGRRLEQLGVYLEPITPIIDYFGPCRAYLSYLPELLERMYRVNPEAWALVTDNGAICPGNAARFQTSIVVPPAKHEVEDRLSQ